ncbi:MAG TPA: hypothetical protein VHH57_01455 [Gaiella sp.]|nr:hypothetical protein [Gaiella sp.]
MSGTARPPDCISREEHRDRDHPVERGLRWLVVALLALFVIAGLVNSFGQRPAETSSTGAGATLRVSGPDDLRGGLLFQGRFELVGERSIAKPTLVLDAGWFDGITLNTVQPEPERTESEDGGIAFEYGPLEAGRTLTAYMEFQVNPTTVGRRSQGVELRDGERPLATVDRPVTIFP